MRLEPLNEAKIGGAARTRGRGPETDSQVISVATDFAAIGSQIWNRAKLAQEGLAMTRLWAKCNFIAIFSVITLGAALSFAIAPARAGDDVSEDQIVRALTPKAKAPLTRGLSIGPQTADPAPNPAEAKIIDSVRGRTTRSLSNAEREEIATIAKDKPNIDLTITFDYNAADISAKSLPEVQKLGRALTNDNLKGSTFLLAGHTDAVGGEAYNQELSERRADSIKRYLMDNYHITAGDLVTVGYGKSKLKDSSQPLAEVNRRVQVVIMENKTTASKYRRAQPVSSFKVRRATFCNKIASRSRAGRAFVLELAPCLRRSAFAPPLPLFPFVEG